MAKKIIMPKGTSELVDSAKMRLAHAEHLLEPVAKESHRASLALVEIALAGRDLDRIPVTYKAEVRNQEEKAA